MANVQGRRVGLAVGLAGGLLAAAAARAFEAGGQTAYCSDHRHHHDLESRTDFPFLVGHGDFKLHFDQIFDARDSGDEIYWGKAHAHGDLGLYLNRWLRLETTIKIEELHQHGGCPGGRDHGGHHDHDDHDDHDDDDDDDHDDHAGHAGHHGFGGKDRFFDDHVAVIEQLKATARFGSVELFGGKFNPRTGLDMHAFPGQYGYEMAEEYSILERIGAGGRVWLDSEWFGRLTLEGSSFFADTTFLNQGIGARRDQPHSRSDGGLANTESFESFALSLSGTGWYTNVGDTIHALNWIVGGAWQSGGVSDRHDDCQDERRWSVGAEYVATLSPQLAVRVIGEWMHADNYAGVADVDSDFATVGIGIDFQGWRVGGTYTAIDRNGGEENGHYLQGSAGYQWNNGLGVHFVLKEDDHEGARRRSAGLTVSYHFGIH